MTPEGVVAVEDAGRSEDAASQFGRLLAEHWPRAYHFVYRLCGDPDQAEELLQQAAEEAFRSFHRFQPGTRFDRWFLRIVYHTFVDAVRRARRRSLFSLDQLPAGRLVAGSWSDPEALVEATLDGPVQRALNALSPEYRSAVVLVDLLGYSYEEAAEVLRCPVGTVRSRLHRGRLALREWLKPYVDALRRGALG